MKIEDSYINGTIFFPFEKEKLSFILENGGITTIVGEWSLRVIEYPSFKISYVGNITPENPYEIECDGYKISIAEVSHWCEKLAACLKFYSIKYEFTHFDSEGNELKSFGN